ncbi:MAG TPA: serine/threonine-protein kinase [Ktedonobacteraceae bacterium]|nr:serine/threonine-protein kinase [Ktedonobacteraceae bacterium]
MQQEQLVLPKGVTIRGPTGERYVIERLLGKGEMSAVYLVRDRRSPRNLFALKEVINPNKQDRERFLFEARVLKRLQHSALPRVYRVFEHNNLRRVYILMDYISGQNLEELRLQQPDARFPLPLVIALLSPIVKALAYLHAQDPPIIHRDIKPANVIIPPGADEAMLVDFGSAKEYRPNGNATVAARRTPGYAAPEQYGSGTSPRTDIYGLGATFYALLTGTPPVDALSRTALSWDDNLDPLKRADLFVPSIPEPAAEALQRALSLKSSNRFATIEECWQALTASNDGQSPQNPPTISIEATVADESQPSDTEDISTIDATDAVTTSPGRTSHALWQAIFILILAIVLLALAFGAMLYFHAWIFGVIFKLTW